MEQFMPNLRDERVTGAIRRLVLYSLAIICVPLSSMFFFKRVIFEDWLGYRSSDSNMYSAIIAVIEVHIILAFFVYAAWKEEFTPGPPMPVPIPEKQD